MLKPLKMFFATSMCIWMYVCISVCTGLFSESTRRYGVPAPFFKTRKFFFLMYYQLIERSSTFSEKEITNFLTKSLTSFVVKSQKAHTELPNVGSRYSYFFFKCPEFVYM